MSTGRGMLITLDGPGGVGKSTAITATQQALAAAGRTVHTASQPSATDFGQAVRAVAQSMHGRALALAVAADRLHQLETELRPALAAGRTVLLDRYLPSTLVLQRADGVPVEDLLAMNAGIDVPDLSVILFAQADTVLQPARPPRHPPPVRDRPRQHPAGDRPLPGGDPPPGMARLPHPDRRRHRSHPHGGRGHDRQRHPLPPRYRRRPDHHHTLESTGASP